MRCTGWREKRRKMNENKKERGGIHRKEEWKEMCRG